MSGVLIIAEHRAGELRPVTLELVASAGTLKGGAGKVTVAVIGPEPARFTAALQVPGIDDIVTVAAGSGDFDPDTMAHVIGELIRGIGPRVVLVPHSVDAFGYASVVATSGNHGFATDVFKVEDIDGEIVATRGGYGQKVNVEVDFPGRTVVVLAIRAGGYKPVEGTESVPVSVVAVSAAEMRVHPREYIELSSADDVDITAADFILTVGRGIGEEAKVAQFRELAEAVGATLCCSRPIADSGWLPKSRQVGQSGKTAAACKLYLALGVSGAIQHLAGMKHVSTIVAVNSDPGASIFSVAKYGIVGDLFEVAEELKTHF